MGTDQSKHLGGVEMNGSNNSNTMDNSSVLGSVGSAVKSVASVFRAAVTEVEDFEKEFDQLVADSNSKDDSGDDDSKVGTSNDNDDDDDGSEFMEMTPLTRRRRDEENPSSNDEEDDNDDDEDNGVRRGRKIPIVGEPGAFMVDFPGAKSPTYLIERIHPCFHYIEMMHYFRYQTDAGSQISSQFFDLATGHIVHFKKELNAPSNVEIVIDNTDFDKELTDVENDVSIRTEVISNNNNNVIHRKRIHNADLASKKKEEINNQEDDPDVHIITQQEWNNYKAFTYCKTVDAILCDLTKTTTNGNDPKKILHQQHLLEYAKTFPPILAACHQVINLLKQTKRRSHFQDAIQGWEEVLQAHEKAKSCVVEEAASFR